MFIKKLVCTGLMGILLLGSIGMVQAEETAQDTEAGELRLIPGQKIEAAPVAEEETVTVSSTWDGPVLTKGKGVNYGPSGKETYYNLPMEGVVRIMRAQGFSEEEYPYWEREDGVKMLGDYVMVAANLSVHPRGSLVESSLGIALVCDTGGFAASNPNQLDIAVNW